VGAGGCNAPGHPTSVSTTDQKADLQAAALTVAVCVRVWTDKDSGPLDRRSQLDPVLDHLRAGDTLVVRRLDTSTAWAAQCAI